ncbi:hypothetical protein N7468_000757 [Penicillium chermesinum]|uniref:Uncharacterized protein n=1 Tax=Penicillium chermesinum TaxID=63820 RepID=A0A9W9U0Q8_9EURO|nr:uncharacterized protein N7468_000757 [Penicillium chermesinum]KAJ5249306.1 hypothetical protein N7468_000757 [Penicillium chermesinum]
MDKSEWGLPPNPKCDVLRIKGRVRDRDPEASVHRRTLRTRLEEALPDTILKCKATIKRDSGFRTQVWNAYGIFMFTVDSGIYKFGLLVPLSKISDSLKNRARKPWYTAFELAEILSQGQGLAPLIHLKKVILEMKLYREDIIEQKNLNALALLYRTRVGYPFGDKTKECILQKIEGDESVHGLYHLFVGEDDKAPLWEYKGRHDELRHRLKYPILQAKMLLLYSKNPLGLNDSDVKSPDE